MKTDMDFIHADIRQSLLKMTIPLFIAMLLLFAYTMVDSFWVGNLLGEHGYAVLTTASGICVLLYAMAGGIGNGISIAVSQAIGKGDSREPNRTVTLSLLVAAVFCIGLTICLEGILPEALCFFQTPAEIFDETLLYLRIFVAGFFFVFLYMQYTSIYRSFGNPALQAATLLLGTILNAGLDPLFIGWYGIEGAAYATIISEAGCLLFVLLCGSRKGYFHYARDCFDYEKIRAIILLAIPSCIQSLIPALSSMILIAFINQFSLTEIAAYGVLKLIENILFYPAMAMNMALTVIMGQCYGAGFFDRMEAYQREAIKTGLVIITVLTILTVIFCVNISLLFVSSDEVASIMSHGFYMISAGYFCYMVTSIFLAKMAGCGKPARAMWTMFFYYIAIRVPLAAVLMKTSLAIDGIWIAILLSHLLALLIAWRMNKKENASLESAPIS